MNAIQGAQQFTNRHIELLRAALKERLAQGDYSVIIGGSYARGEASAESDLDFYIVTNAEAATFSEELLNEINAILTKAVKPPSAGGPFGKTYSSESMQKNIGGDDDNNVKFTVRMLFLTEGECLFNPKLFASVRTQLVRRYVQPHVKREQIAKFFLNDTIRYYRTICVDFENKTVERNKAWGPRNIKLVFSRKLLYFSGVIAAAELAGLGYEEKVQKMLTLLAMRPIDRIRHVCGSKADAALEIYDHFLEAFSRREVRELVAQVRYDDDTRESNAEFRSLKDKGRNFSRALIGLLNSQYRDEHPIHDALIM